MIEEVTPKDAFLIVCFLRAATTNVFPSLRLASVTIRDENPDILFIYDGAISSDDIESLNLIDTYFGVHFYGNLVQGTWDFIRVDYPEPIPYFPGECLYARYEEPQLVRVIRPVLMENKIGRRAKVLVALQRAMLNHIFPQIRGISVEWDTRSAHILCFVDGELTADMSELLALIRWNFVLQFPAEEMIECKFEIIRIDMPQRMYPDSGVFLYIRKEQNNYSETPPIDFQGWKRHE